MPLLSKMVLGILWAAWFYPFLFRAPHRNRRESITRTGPTVAGILLETGAFAVAYAGSWHSGVQPGALRLAGALASGSVGIVLAWGAVKHLGRQFRVNAGLYADHELVTTGPYGIVRHPIYSAMFAMLLCTLLLVSPWQRMLLPLFLFLAGTEIRVRTEDALLESRFEQRFRAYRARVSAYLPFVR